MEGQLSRCRAGLEVICAPVEMLLTSIAASVTHNKVSSVCDSTFYMLLQMCGCGNFLWITLQTLSLPLIKAQEYVE